MVRWPLKRPDRQTMPDARVRYRFGLYEADLATGQLLRQGQQVRIQDQPFQLLVALLEANGAIVTRDALRQRLWRDDTFVEFDKSLGVAVAKLRSALGDDAANPRFVETLPRRGYRFIAPVAASGHGLEGTAQAPVAVSPEPTAPDPGSGVRRRVWGASIAAVLVIAAAAGWYRHRVSGARLAPRAAIVVAQFENATGDPLFDGTLRRAAIIGLSQSPYVRVLTDDAIGETLQGLGHPPDESLTAGIARQACQRARAAAIVDGSIRRSGEAYVLAVEADRCDDGRVLAREAASIERKDRVLPALGHAIEQLRERFGESRASLQTFNTPIEVATTDSLEALHAYQLGVELRGRAENIKAIPALRTAVTLDPQFAIAYAQLGSSYSNLGNVEAGLQYFRKAFELRDRATEPERFYITGRYFDIVTGEREKASETYRLWTRTYPDDWLAFNALSNDANLMGRYALAAEAARRTTELQPNRAFGYMNLLYALEALHRFDEAKAVCVKAVEHDRDNGTVHLVLYAIAAFDGDTASAAREIAWSDAHPDRAEVLYAEAEHAASEGRLAESERLFDEVQRRDRAAGSREQAAIARAVEAEFLALMGDIPRASRLSDEARAVAHDEVTLGLGALVDAFAGRTRSAEQSLEQLSRAQPLATLAMGVYVPMAAGSLAYARGASASEVTRTMAPAVSYELGQEAGLGPAYVRGIGLLRARAWPEAAREFHRVIDNVGVDPVTPLYPLSYLGVARAEAALGHVQESHQAYAAVLNLWRNADPDVAVVTAARREMAALASWRHDFERR